MNLLPLLDSGIHVARKFGAVLFSSIKSGNVRNYEATNLWICSFQLVLLMEIDQFSR